AATGAELLERIEQAAPDALVIDIGLPDADGRDLCQALRARGIDSPVLFLTARDALVDRIAGFDAGGDDYLAKPFAFVELVARLEALLRRSGGDGVLDAAGLRLNPVSHSAADGSREVALTPTEFRLLARLMSRPGEAGAPAAAGLLLQPVSHSPAGGGRDVALAPAEFRLLARLTSRPGEAVRRRELARAGWPHGAIARENTLDAYVAHDRAVGPAGA